MDRRVVMPAGQDFRFLAEDRPEPHAFDYGRRIDFIGLNSHEARYLISDEHL